MTLPRGRGPSDARIMFVGEAYGQVERALQRPFSGPAGKVLENVMLQAGLNPASCYFTNIVNAQPPGNDLSAWITKGIPNDIVADGIVSLSEEIDSIRPNVIVPLGNWPLWAFYGQPLNKQGVPTGILDYRGYLLEARKLARGTKIIPTVHPSHLLQGGAADTPLAILDLQRAKRESLFPDIRRRPRVCIVNPEGEEREAIRHRLLHEGDRLCIDIEYIGSRLLCVGFAVSAEWATTIIIRSPSDLAWCRSLIESGRPLCAQNAMFEMGILDWHYQIDAISHMDFDTMVAAYVLNIEYTKNLGALGALYTDLPAWWDVINWEAIKDGSMPIDVVWEYNCIDCMATYEIMEQQEQELATDPKMVEAFRFDMSKLPPLWRMGKRGIRLDHEKIAELRYDAESDEIANQYLVNQIAETFGIEPPKKQTDLNVKSKNQVVQLLQAVGVKMERKTKPTKRFPDGQYNDDSITLMEYYRIARDRDNKIQMKLIEAILNTREARDMISKNLNTEWDDDGRARCIYDCTKTGTRRLSSKEFFPTGRGTNLQNKPAPGSSPRWGRRYRSTFIADPGYEFGYADLKSAEFLVVAELTQDPKMLEFAQMAITGKGNVHKETAAFIFEEEFRKTGMTAATVDKSSAFYFLGKKTRHSGNYMVGWKELQGRINGEAAETRIFVTAADVKKMLDGYLRLHPGLKRWWNETEIEARQNGGLIRNLFGYPRIFHGHISQNLPSIVAFRPQSTVGDCLNMGLVCCDNDPELAELGFQMFLNVHDSIGFQYPKSNRDEVFKRVRRNMEVPIPILKTGRTLTIPVECEFGPNWGDLEEWHG